MDTASGTFLLMGEKAEQVVGGLEREYILVNYFAALNLATSVHSLELADM